MVGGGEMDLQSVVVNDRLEVTFKVNLIESLEYRILRSGKVIKEQVPYLVNTFTNWGKEQVARCVSNYGSTYPINEVRARIDGVWDTVPATTVDVVNGSLMVVSGTFSTPGTYEIVAGGNSDYSSQNHNEISTSIPLSSDQEIVFTIYYGFSGLNMGGNTITAGRLGNVAGYYPVDTIGVNFNGALTTRDAIKSVSNNTLELTCTEFTSSGTYDSFSAITSNPVGEEYYHVFGGHTIVLFANQELVPYLYFIYG